MPRYQRSQSRSYSPQPRGGGGSGGGGGGGGRSPSPDEEFRIHIADLGMDPDKQEIEKCFSKFGPLKEVWLAKNPPCFSFVVFQNRDDAEESIRIMDGKTVCGSRIRVTWARPRTRGRQRRGFDPNLRCYQCGERGHFSRDCEEIWRYRDKYRGRSRSGSPQRRPAYRSRSRSPGASSRRYYGGGGGAPPGMPDGRRRNASPYSGGGGGGGGGYSGSSRQPQPRYSRSSPPMADDRMSSRRNVSRSPVPRRRRSSMSPMRM